VLDESVKGRKLKSRNKEEKCERSSLLKRSVAGSGGKERMAGQKVVAQRARARVGSIIQSGESGQPLLLLGLRSHSGGKKTADGRF